MSMGWNAADQMKLFWYCGTERRSSLPDILFLALQKFVELNRCTDQLVDSAAAFGGDEILKNLSSKIWNQNSYGAMTLQRCRQKWDASIEHQ